MKIKVDIDFGKYVQTIKSTVESDPWTFLFLSFIFATHMIQISFPSDGSMIFDEAHYIPATLATLNGVAANMEHPPLSKLISALGIALLGNNWFGWRFPQVLMQIGALYLFYLISKRFLGKYYGLGATMLLGLDTIFFIHGGALLIDMASFLFCFLAYELYFRRHYYLSASSMALAFLSREMSLFYFFPLAFYHLASNWKNKENTKSKENRQRRQALKLGAKYVALCLIIFLGSLWFYDLAYQPAISTNVTNYVNANVVVNATGTPITTIYSTVQSTSKEIMWEPLQNLAFIWNYHGPSGMNFPNRVNAPYDYAWNWILPIESFTTPTYYRVDVSISSGEVVKHYTPIWYNAQPNLALWYAIWPAMIGLFYALIKKKERLSASFFGLGILSNYAPWIALSILFNRIGFNYYFIWTLPFIALSIAFTWKQCGNWGKWLMAWNLLFALMFFLIFFPVRPMP